MSSFSENWSPEWLVRKDYPRCHFSTKFNGKFRSGRDKYEWTATSRNGENLSTRVAMELISKSGRPYFVVSKTEINTRDEYSSADIYG